MKPALFSVLCEIKEKTGKSEGFVYIGVMPRAWYTRTVKTDTYP